MADDRERLESLRRMAELQSRAAIPAPQQQERQPFSLKQEIMNNPLLLTPWGMAARGSEEISKAIEHGAYKAGGAVTDYAQSRGWKNAPEAGFAANVGIQAIPTVLGAAAGSRILAPKMEEAARGLVRSAIKPSGMMNESGKVEPAISTILEKSLPTSEGGLAGIKKTTKGIDSKVEQMIASDPSYWYGGGVNTESTAKHLANEIKALENVSMSGKKRESLQKMLSEYISENPSVMPVQRAHELKRGNYAEVGNRPFMASADASTAMEDQARMAVARGQREATVAAVPETAPLLKEQSELLNVLKIAGPQLMREGNRNPLSFGAFSVSNPGALALWLADRSAAAKGQLAHALHSGSKTAVPTTAGAVSAAALADQLRLGKPER